MVGTVYCIEIFLKYFQNIGQWCPLHWNIFKILDIGHQQTVPTMPFKALQNIVSELSYVQNITKYSKYFEKYFENILKIFEILIPQSPEQPQTIRTPQNLVSNQHTKVGKYTPNIPLQYCHKFTFPGLPRASEVDVNHH